MSGTGLSVPAAAGGVSDELVAFAAELIDRSGTAPVIEAALAKRTGRPRRLLGVPAAAATERAFKAAYRRVRYCFHAIVSVADPSALPKTGG